MTLAASGRTGSKVAVAVVIFMASTLAPAFPPAKTKPGARSKVTAMIITIAAVRFRFLRFRLFIIVPPLLNVHSQKTDFLKQ
jgi:hypothetical protein